MSSVLTVTASVLCMAAMTSHSAAQMAHGEEVLHEEVANFPAPLREAIVDYADRLVAAKDQFKPMTISNCHFVYDTIAQLAQERREEYTNGVFEGWVIRSRALAYLSLAKFDDHSRPLEGSYASAMERGAFLPEKMMEALNHGVPACMARLAEVVGPEPFSAQKDDVE